jgi:hypothetical protein
LRCQWPRDLARGCRFLTSFTRVDPGSWKLDLIRQLIGNSRTVFGPTHEYLSRCCQRRYRAVVSHFLLDPSPTGLDIGTNCTKNYPANGDKALQELGGRPGEMSSPTLKGSPSCSAMNKRSTRTLRRIGTER